MAIRSAGIYIIVFFLLLSSGNAADELSPELERFLVAAERGDLNEVQAVVGQVYVNGQRADGMNALLLAVANGHDDVVLFLQKRGVNVNHVNSSGETALTIAQKKGNDKIVESLKEGGAVEDLEEARNLTAIYEEEFRKIKERQKEEAQKKAAGEKALSLRKKGSTLRKEKKYIEAIGLLTQALALNPDDAKTQGNLCMCYIALNNRQKAIVHYKEVKKLDADLAAKLKKRIKAMKNHRQKSKM